MQSEPSKSQPADPVAAKASDRYAPARGLLRIALAAVLLAGACGKAPAGVVLVTVDTLRADHLPVFGYPSTEPTQLERLARRGTRFPLAFSPASVTAAAHASMMTGRYPSFHTVGPGNGLTVLDDATTTLAEIVAARGYATAAIVSNAVLRADLGLAQGFETYDDAFESRELNRNVEERLAGRAVDLAIDWLERERHEPFFLWLHLQDPHGPYAPPSGVGCDGDGSPLGDRELVPGDDHSGYQAIPRYQVFHEERLVSQYRRRYDCEIASVDREIGRLDRFLLDSGLAASTLLILTADHGEAFGEDDFFFAHGHSLGLEQIHVPLIMAGPRVPRDSEIRTPVSTAAVYSTILEALDLTADELAIPSLLPLISGTDAAQPLFAESLGQLAVIHDNSFLRRDQRPPEDRSFWERPNPNSGGFWRPLGTELRRPLDPRGARPILSQDELEAVLGAYATRAAKAQRANRHRQQPRRPGPRALEQLRALGYVD